MCVCADHRFLQTVVQHLLDQQQGYDTVMHVGDLSYADSLQVRPSRLAGWPRGTLVLTLAKRRGHGRRAGTATL